MTCESKLGPSRPKSNGPSLTRCGPSSAAVALIRPISGKLWMSASRVRSKSSQVGPNRQKHGRRLADFGEHRPKLAEFDVGVDPNWANFGQHRSNLVESISAEIARTWSNHGHCWGNRANFCRSRAKLGGILQKLAEFGPILARIGPAPTDFARKVGQSRPIPVRNRIRILPSTARTLVSSAKFKTIPLERWPHNPTSFLSEMSAMTLCFGRRAFSHAPCPRMRVAGGGLRQARRRLPPTRGRSGRSSPLNPRHRALSHVCLCVCVMSDRGVGPSTELGRRAKMG